jgi:hypothetical protein
MKAMIAAVLLMITAQAAQAWGPREQGALAGAAAVLVWQKLDQAARQQPQIVVQQHPVYQPVPQFIPQQHMPIPTGFQEPCQFRGHHARIYDRYGMPIAIRVCE